VEEAWKPTLSGKKPAKQCVSLDFSLDIVWDLVFFGNSYTYILTQWAGGVRLVFIVGRERVCRVE